LIKQVVWILNWWKENPSGSIACTRKQQPRFYWSRLSVVMNDATPLTSPAHKRYSIFKCTFHDPWGPEKYDYTSTYTEHIFNTSYIWLTIQKYIRRPKEANFCQPQTFISIQHKLLRMQRLHYIYSRMIVHIITHITRIFLWTDVSDGQMGAFNPCQNGGTCIDLTNGYTC